MGRGRGRRGDMATDQLRGTGGVQVQTNYICVFLYQHLLINLIHVFSLQRLLAKRNVFSQIILQVLALVHSTHADNPSSHKSTISVQYIYLPWNLPRNAIL